MPLRNIFISIKYFYIVFLKYFPQSCIPRLPRVVSSTLSWILCVENKNVYLRLGQVWTEKFVKFLCWVDEVKVFPITVLINSKYFLSSPPRSDSSSSRSARICRGCSAYCSQSGSSTGSGRGDENSVRGLERGSQQPAANYLVQRRQNRYSSQYMSSVLFAEEDRQTLVSRKLILYLITSSTAL